MSSYAHDCSGGPSGGMDATGNQCNDPSAIAMLDSKNLREAELTAPQKSTSATSISGGSYVPTSHVNAAQKKSSHRTAHTRSKRN